MGWVDRGLVCSSSGYSVSASTAAPDTVVGGDAVIGGNAVNGGDAVIGGDSGPSEPHSVHLCGFGRM